MVTRTQSTYTVGQLEASTEAVADDLKGHAAAAAQGPAGNTGARTPEELETMLEDALLIRDGQALAGLFEAGAVLDVGTGLPARGDEQIARTALAAWHGAPVFVADPLHVLQARDIGLVVSQQCINVLHRDCNGMWRYAIVLRFETSERKPQ